MSVLYIAGTYLILLGVLLLINDFDIYVGFLWVIDLGVGLIFFIFILHFTTFLSQKVYTLHSTKLKQTLILLLLLLTVLFYNYPTTQNKATLDIDWVFRINYVDYYKILNTSEVTDLQTMKDNYFLTNSFEFFLINFSLFFGLISAILASFLVHRIFSFLNYTNVVQNKLLNKVNTNFFIRNQNFMTQQNTSTSTLVWLKKKVKRTNLRWFGDWLITRSRVVQFYRVR